MKNQGPFSLAYPVDGCGFLLDPADWNEDFARACGLNADGSGELTPIHWKVIQFIRGWFEGHGTCPPVVRVGRATGLRLGDLEKLFPDGYVYGACRLAGLGYRDCHHAVCEPGCSVIRRSREPVLLH